MMIGSALAVIAPCCASWAGLPGNLWSGYYFAFIFTSPSLVLAKRVALRPIRRATLFILGETRCALEKMPLLDLTTTRRCVPGQRWQGGQALHPFVE